MAAIAAVSAESSEETGAGDFVSPANAGIPTAGQKLIADLILMKQMIQTAESDLDMAKITQNIDVSRAASLKKEEDQLKAEIKVTKHKIDVNQKLLSAYEKKMAKLDAMIAELTKEQKK